MTQWIWIWHAQHNAWNVGNPHKMPSNTIFFSFTGVLFTYRNCIYLGCAIDVLILCLYFERTTTIKVISISNTRIFSKVLESCALNVRQKLFLSVIFICTPLNFVIWKWYQTSRKLQERIAQSIMGDIFHSLFIFEHIILTPSILHHLSLSLSLSISVSLYF